MKMLIILLISSNAWAFPITHEPFNPHQRDKRMHIAVAAASTSILGGLLKNNTSYTRTEAVFASMAVVTLAGLIKELVVDKSFSTGDVLANSLGVASGGMILGVYFQFE